VLQQYTAREEAEQQDRRGGCVTIRITGVISELQECAVFVTYPVKI